MSDVDHTPVETALNGRYTRFRSVLGKGAYKTVYRGFDSDEALEVAWNKLHVERLQRHELEKVANEVKLLERINHKNIIRFFALLPSTERNGVKTIDFITELMTSGTLKDFLKRAKAIKLKVIRRWSFNVLQAIQYLHSMDPPIMHRDLKCENIFINGHVGEVKIGDLGLSGFKVRDKADSVIGTPEFMAPELYESSYTEKVDIYAFGMCLLEMVTMEYPYSECTTFAQIFKKVYHGEKPKVLDRIMSSPFKNVINACLRREAHRPSAAQLLEDPLFRDWESDPGTENNTSLLKGFNEGNESGSNPSGADIEWSDPLGRPIEVSYADGTEAQRSQASASAADHVQAEPEVVAMQANQQGGFKVGLTIPIEDRIKRVEFPFDPFKDTSEHLAQELVEVFELPQNLVSVIKDAIENQMKIAREQREVAIRNTAPPPQNQADPGTDTTNSSGVTPAFPQGQGGGTGTSFVAHEASERVSAQSAVPEVVQAPRETVVPDSNAYHQPAVTQIVDPSQTQYANVASEPPQLSTDAHHASPDTISSGIREGSTTLSGLPVSMQGQYPKDINAVPVPSVSGHSAAMNSVPVSPMPPAQPFAPEQSPPSTSPAHQSTIQSTHSTPVVHPQTLTQHPPIQGTTHHAPQQSSLPQNSAPVYSQQTSPHSQTSNSVPVTHDHTTAQQQARAAAQQASHVTQTAVPAQLVEAPAVHHVGSTPNTAPVAATQPISVSAPVTVTVPSSTPAQVTTSISQAPLAAVQSVSVEQGRFIPYEAPTQSHHSHQQASTRQPPVVVAPVSHTNDNLDQSAISTQQQHVQQVGGGSVASQQVPARQDTLSPIPQTEPQKTKSYAQAAAAAPSPDQAQHNGPSALSPPMQSQQSTSDSREVPSQLDTTTPVADVPVAMSHSVLVEQAQYVPTQPAVSLAPSHQPQAPSAGPVLHQAANVTPNSVSPPQQRMQQPLEQSPASSGIASHPSSTLDQNPAPAPQHFPQPTPIISVVPQVRQEPLPAIPETEPPPAAEQSYMQSSSAAVQTSLHHQLNRPPMPSPPLSVQSSVPENSEVGSQMGSDNGGATYGDSLPDSAYPPSVTSHQDAEHEAQLREPATRRPPAAPVHGSQSESQKGTTGSVISHSASEQVLRAPGTSEALQHPHRSISAPAGSFSVDEAASYRRIQPELAAAGQAILAGLSQAGEPVVSSRPLQHQTAAVNTSSDSRPGIVVVGGERRKSSLEKGNRRGGGTANISAASLPEYTHSEAATSSRTNLAGSNVLEVSKRQFGTGNNLRGNVNDTPSLAPPMSMGRRSSSWRSSHSESSFHDVGIRASPSDTTLGSTYDQKWLACCLELMEHSTKGRYGAVAQKLDQGYPVTFADYDRRTPLHLASSRGHLDVVTLLIERGASVKAVDRWGRTALSDAIKNRHDHVAHFLRANGAEEDMDVRSDAYGSIMLQSAARGDLEEVRRRLVAGANANFADYDKRTALHLACTEGHLDIAELLLVNEANWNAMDNFGATPVDDAVRNGHKNILRLLRQYGAEIPKHLLGAHSDSEYQLGLDLVENAAKGRINAVKKCLRNGANPSFMDYDRRTALHLAAVEGHVAVVETLLRAGADANAVDRWGGTPRMGAVNAHMTAVVDELDNWAQRMASRDASAVVGENTNFTTTNGRSTQVGTGRNMEKIRERSQGSGTSMVSVMQHVFADGFVDRQASMSSMMQHMFADGFVDRQSSATRKAEVLGGPAVVDGKKARGVPVPLVAEHVSPSYAETPPNATENAVAIALSDESGDVAREIVESVVEESTTGAMLE